MLRKKRTYDPILPASGDWPIVQLSRNKKQFIKEVIAASVENIKSLTGGGKQLMDELESTRYREKTRIRRDPWKVDPKDDLKYWDGIKSQLVDISNSENNQEKEAEVVLKSIVSRYAYEILSNFKRSHYKMARAIATFGFARLLNASRIPGIRSLWSKELTLQDKIHITGDVQGIRNLAQKGTVIMVPTHFSNLDSILVGWVIHILGLPAFIYGAGLNLFNMKLFAYFMNSLGAYKVDRRKKNRVYLETLRTYSRLAIVKGCHSIFFPGGTRSRSGKLESKLKLGLLNSTVEAQRSAYMTSDDPTTAQKVFIVPVVLNYHFVLEAPALIDQYLKQKGQERYYVDNDQYSTSYKVFKFLLKFFFKGSDISVSIGRGMDVLGNYVDQDGNSIGKDGEIIQTWEYFMHQGKIQVNKQRENEYTNMLSNVIVEEYHRVNQVFASHLVAFVAFEMIKNKYQDNDLYNILRLSEEDATLAYVDFKQKTGALLDVILNMHQEGRIDIAEHLQNELDSVIKIGLNNVGMYHAQRPLVKTKEGNISTQNLNLLYYYHNRLMGYDFEKYI